MRTRLLESQNFKLILSFVLVICFHYISLAQEYELGGYVKYLFSAIDQEFIHQTIQDHTLHSRLNGKFYYEDLFTFSIGVRDRIVYGDSPRKIPYYDENFVSKNYLFDLDKFIWKRKSSIHYIEFDRLWLDAHLNSFQVSLGRQRIAWGTSLVWNITDVFNPFSILDIDYEERPGVDALRLQYFSSELSKFDLALSASGVKKDNLTGALQYSTNVNEYDLFFLCGSRKQRLFIGGAWAGNISGGGFRGELLFSEDPLDASAILHRTILTSVVLSGDYTLSNSLYLHSELLYQSHGVTANAKLYLVNSQIRGLFSPSKLSFFQEVSYQLMPLVRTGCFTLFNPYDKSIAVVSMIQWSVIENFDASFFGLFFTGNTLTEYGGYGKAIYIRLMYSF